MNILDVITQVNDAINSFVWVKIGLILLIGTGILMTVVTKTEDDTTAAAIFTALEARDDISFDYLVDHEDDTGYIHHIFDCEAC